MLILSIVAWMLDAVGPNNIKTQAVFHTPRILLVLHGLQVKSAFFSFF